MSVKIASAPFSGLTLDKTSTEYHWKERVMNPEVFINIVIALNPNKMSEREKRMSCYLAQFIMQFRADDFMLSRPSFLRLESLLTIRRGVELTQLCRLITSPFLSLKEADFKNLFLENEGCVGAVVQHLNLVFKTNDLQSTLFPFSGKIEINPKDGVTFYSFNLEGLDLRKETASLRFLQSAYKVAYALKKVESLEFLPSRVLKRRDLRVQRRIPDLSVSNKMALNMAELLPTLKALALHDQAGKGYLLGIHSGDVRHAIALYLQEPYHFMDVSYGVAVADSLEQLMLFLVLYLTNKYENFHSFALLEFGPISKGISIKEN